MKKIALTASTIVLAVAIASNAGALSTDGDWSDWFAYTGDVNSNNWQESMVTLTDSTIRTVADEEGPSPGTGGQVYDIEQIFYLFEDDDSNALTGGTMHIGLVTGFGPNGVIPDDFYAGDLFVDIGSDGGTDVAGYDIAIATSTASAPRGKPGSSSPNPTQDSDLAGTAWANTGAPNWTEREVFYPQHDSSNPYRVDEQGSGVLDVTSFINPSVQWGGMGPHNFLEVSFDVDATLEEQITGENGGIGLHWTMECGNDAINVQDNVPLVPDHPIPEPSTWALMTMGVASAIFRAKLAA